jgi:sterol desaturase/sphingolipid hydroxylase (fatty acid hydroxylase superfamily)
VNYLYWLLGLSAAFVVLERVRPARPRQPVVRPQLANDVGYLLFNGHIWALLTGGITAWCATSTRAWLDARHLLPSHGLLEGRSFAAQCVVFLVASDFLQWCVHNLLHRVPFLWSFHKLHHSVRQMDFLASFRFHWMELVVYRVLLYVPLDFLGGDGGPLFAVAVFATFWGHLNHANLDVGIGPLAFLFNSPRMHLWHHDISSEGGTAKNFGIVLSIWDWIFGTAYWPRERAPQSIGYPGDIEMPRDFARQEFFPITRRR